MNRFRLMPLFSTLLCSMTISSVCADDFLLPREEYGQVNLTLPQSLISRKESNISGNGNYEPLALSPPQDALRRLSHPIGRLDVLYKKGTSSCTASIVSSEYILTNFHCVPGDKKYGGVEKVSILMGYYSQLDTAGTERFTVSAIPVAADKNLDFALLRVNGNPSAKWGMLTLENRDPYPGESLMLIHHPLGLPLHVTRGRCRAAQPKAVENTDIFHTCDTEGGSSGSPILSIDGSHMIGIHFSGVFGQEAFNRGKRLTEISKNYAVLRDLSKFSSNQPPPVNSPPLFVTQPRQPVSVDISARHDKSTVYLKSSYSSVEAMDSAGCDSVRVMAKQKAEQSCSDKQLHLQGIKYQDCTYTGRNVRRYAVSASALCAGDG